MGVIGLAEHVRRSNVMRKMRIAGTSATQGVPIVVAGTALAFALYSRGFNWMIGGQYRAFEERFLDFLNHLEECGFRVVSVVFEGTRAIEGKELARMSRDETTTIRVHQALATCKEEREFNVDYRPPTIVLPLLCIPIAIEATLKAGFNVIVSVGDSDATISRIAQEEMCFVLGNDSDFYLFDLPCGFINFDTLAIRNGIAEFQLYRRIWYAQYWEVEEECLPMLGPAVGNDYLSVSELLSFYGPRSARPSDVIEFLQENAKDCRLIECCRLYVDFFDPENPQEWIARLVDSSLRYTETKNCRYSKAKQCEYGDLYDIQAGKFFCTPVYEDLEMPCAWKFSTAIRAHGYALRGNGSYVTENMRGKCMSHRTNRQSGRWDEAVSYSTAKVKVRAEKTKMLSFDGPFKLIGLCLAFLLKEELISISELLAVVFACVCPFNGADKIKSISISRQMVHFVAIFETSIFSCSMAYGLPILASDVPDGFLVFFFQNVLSQYHWDGSLGTLAKDIAGEDSSRFISFLRNINDSAGNGNFLEDYLGEF